MRLLLQILVLLLISNKPVKKEKTLSIKIEDEYEILNTFSGNIRDEHSFHFIFSKSRNSKKYTMHGFLFNGKRIEKLEKYTSKNNYSAVSFHKKDHNIYLLLSYKKNNKVFLDLLNIDTETNKILKKLTEPHDNFASVLSKKNRSILFYKTNKGIRVNQYIDNNKLPSLFYNFKSRRDSLKRFFDGNVSSVKTDEFVSNGSTLNLRMYLDKKRLIFTKERIRENQTSFVTLPINVSELTPSKVKVLENDKGYKYYLKSTSFYHNGNIYLFSNDKKEGVLKIYNLKSMSTKIIQFDNNFKEKIIGSYHYTGLKNFLKEAGKGSHNTTITVNRTTNDNVKIRFDFVDRKYINPNNFWWHQQQFIRDQQINNLNKNIPRRFGPSQHNDLHFFTYPVVKKKEYFEIILDQHNCLLEDRREETKYREIDKTQYIQRIQSIKDYDHTSISFNNKTLNYIAYSKKLKAFIFRTKELR